MEPCIWNPRHKDLKDKKKINDAWVRISQTSGLDILKLKNKRWVDGDIKRPPSEEKGLNSIRSRSR